MEQFPKSHRLENVRYEIRGPVMQEAMKMEAAGHQKNKQREISRCLFW